MPILVDSNVIFDVVHQDPVWFEWSLTALENHSADGLVANAMIYAELCSNAETTQEVDDLLQSMGIVVLEIPPAALFLAAKAHVAYRRRGGSRTSALPDFFIGAHAEVAGLAILTRDQARYRSYFPTVPLVCPAKEC
jgi:predicted nucleic acid-binding protein